MGPMAGPIQRRLLTAFLLLLVAVVVPSAVLVERWLGENIRQQVEDSLQQKARIIADQLEAFSPDPKTFVKRVAPLSAARITIVLPDGKVVADSDVAEEALPTLENHADRPEIRVALTGVMGTDVRRSATLGQELLYVAHPVGNPVRKVVRLSLPLDQVRQAVGRAQSAILLGGLLATGLALVLGAYVAKRLSRPIVAMTRSARAMAHGDFQVTPRSYREDELGELERALDTLRRQLAARIAELAGEGEKLRAVLFGMAEGVALILDGAIAVANPAFMNLFGVAHPVEGLTPLEAVRLPELGDVIEAALRDSQTSMLEVQVRTRVLRVQATRIGRMATRQVVVVVTDITESRRLERLRRDFVANASHELRTPVAAIVGVAETLAEGAADDPEARASFLAILQRHAERLSRLTSDLLDLARLEGGYRSRPEVVSVAAACETVFGTLRRAAEYKHIALEVDITPGLACVAERAAVEQILGNLVDNAIKYTGEGGRVKVTASSSAPDEVLACVEDTGVGIAEEHLDRLFERFYRVDTARSRALGGTGLGLAIVKHLVLANAGTIRVESKLGEGSRFWVTFPCA
jgi:two-component system phosphate regulon sensor histidine kinase PhoR